MSLVDVTARGSFRAVATLGACAVLLAGCGGDGESADSEPAATETVTQSVTVSAEPAPSDDGGETASPDESAPAASGLPPKPRRDECVRIKTPRNGRYTVYDAGTAVVRRDGDRLRVGKVTQANGWKARVTERGGDDDVTVEFTPGGRGAELELDVELDDGRVRSEICADDRDDRDDRDDGDDRD
jgi:hypothetical protein